MQVSFQSRKPQGQPRSPALVCGARRELRRPEGDAFAAAHDLAQELIGGEVATAETLAAVDAAHPGAILVRIETEGLTGLLAILPLRQAGRRALLEGRLNGLAPDLRLVASPREPAVAVYAWGCAARTRGAARAVMETTAALPEEAFPGAAFYARAATPAGLRALTQSLGYAPVGDRGLLRRAAPVRRAA